MLIEKHPVVVGMLVRENGLPKCSYKKLTRKVGSQDTLAVRRARSTNGRSTAVDHSPSSPRVLLLPSAMRCSWVPVQMLSDLCCLVLSFRMFFYLFCDPFAFCFFFSTNFCFFLGEKYDRGIEWKSLRSRFGVIARSFSGGCKKPGCSEVCSGTRCQNPGLEKVVQAWFLTSGIVKKDVPKWLKVWVTRHSLQVAAPSQSPPTVAVAVAQQFLVTSGLRMLVFSTVLTTRFF